jgi:uncharacterized protein DUF4071
MMPSRLCHVLMPSGTQSVAGRRIDFDAVYRDLIGPAIAAAGLHAERTQQTPTAGIVPDAELEQIMLCDCAIFDITAASASTLYALGARRTLRSGSTLVVYARSVCRLPLDAELWRRVPYELSAEGGVGDAQTSARALADMLVSAGSRPDQNPLYRLVDGTSAGDLERLKTDVFREMVEYSAPIKQALERARHQGADALRVEQRKLGDLAHAEVAVVIDLFLSYRAVKAWPDMIALVGEMAPALAASTMVQEQLAFALNRAGRGDEAEGILHRLIERRGDNSETCSLLGRVYKDRWQAVLREAGRQAAAPLLEQAIEAYLRGFEADWRDAFPGINAITLMEFREPPDPRRQRLIPVVRYAVERRIAVGQHDYWDHATLIELAVLARDAAAAQAALHDALSCAREVWEPESTARNLSFIRELRAQHGEGLAWVENIETALLAKADALR